MRINLRFENNLFRINMERISVLDKVKEFMKKIEEDDPAPVPLEESEEGENVKLELDLGVYDVADPSTLKFDGVGTIIPELLDKDEESPAPLIEDISK